MILKKKKTITVLLVVLISLAVYLNAAYKKDQADYPLTEEQLTEETAKNLGEAKFVDSQDGEEQGKEATDAASINDYFSQARLLRSKTKDEALEILRSVADDPNASEDVKQKALLDITTLANTKEQEGTAENLIKAKGFTECMVYISTAGVNVAVQSAGLSAKETAQIKEIIVSETNFKPEKIKITEVK